MLKARTLRLGSITSSQVSTSSVPVQPLKTGVRCSAARSLSARNPVPHPARVHFWPPDATTSATSNGASTTPKPWMASTIRSRSPITWRMPSMSARYPVRESTRLTMTATVPGVS